MSITGAFLILFVTFHALMNGVAIFWPAAYNVICEFLGANWYALVGTAVLALGFLLHIVYAFWLTVQNRKARGNARYEVTSRPPQVEWSSKNMLVLGIVILAFLVLHMVQFWSKMQLAEITGCLYTTCDGQTVPPAAGTWFLQLAFSNGIFLACYLIGFIALWFHLTHGFWSMFQSCGWNGKIWMPRLKAIGNVWVTLVVVLFMVEAIVFTVRAHQNYYTDCPVLQEQYAEMAAAHDENVCNATCDAAQTETICTESVKCANENCTDQACDPTLCNCPEGTCGQPGVCKENNCPGCPATDALTVETETVTETPNE